MSFKFLTKVPRGYCTDFSHSSGQYGVAGSHFRARGANFKAADCMPNVRDLLTPVASINPIDRDMPTKSNKHRMETRFELDLQPKRHQDPETSH